MKTEGTGCKKLGNFRVFRLYLLQKPLEAFQAQVQKMPYATGLLRLQNFAS
jgi:hypothetical protein